MHAKAILVVCLLIATALTAIAASPSARAGTLINEQLVEDLATTTALGGGDAVFVRFGADAAFGVVYGTDASPNNIYIVAIKARYLGVAQVVDTQGREVASNRPIKIYTLYAVKLDNILEFRDSNGNDIADYARVYNESTERFSDYVNAGDTLYKKADLHRNWTRGPIVRENTTTSRSWTFNLTAQGLPYDRISGWTGSIAGSLDLVRFTFHLNASLEQVDNATVPQWRVTVGTLAGRYFMTDVERLTDLTVSGKVVRYDLKWDQEFQGWDYVPGNGPPARHLLLELNAIVGNFIPASVVDAWVESRLLARMAESGTARFNGTAGERTANETTRNLASPDRLRSPYVDFGGNWTRIARFVWVTDSVVDGVTTPMYGQVMAGWRFIAIGERGNAFAGFVLLAGLSYEGGTTIVHDPDVQTDVQADLQLPGAPDGGGLFAAAVGAVVIIAILLLVAFVVSKRRKKESPPPPGA